MTDRDQEIAILLAEILSAARAFPKQALSLKPTSFWPDQKQRVARLLELGAGDAVVELTKSPERVVRLVTAKLVYDFAPQATEQAFLSLRHDKDWIGQDATRGLGIMFPEYFEEIFGQYREM